MDQVKKAFKGLFKSKKNNKTEAKPTPVAAAEPSAAQATPSQTTPAAPVPATAPVPTPAKTETLPAAPAHVQDEPKKDEAAALVVVKEATQSRSTHRSTSVLSHSSPDDEGGGRWRHRVTREDHSDDGVGDTNGHDICTCIWPLARSSPCTHAEFPYL